MSQLFSGKDNHIDYQSFGADAKYRVPTMKNRWEIPLFPKAVFYVFVFDYIHDSATVHNLSPRNFPLSHFRSCMQ